VWNIVQYDQINIGHYTTHIVSLDILTLTCLFSGFSLAVFSCPEGKIKVRIIRENP
jgi:hypothetical protein